MPITMGRSLGDKSSFKFNGDGTSRWDFAVVAEVASLAALLVEVWVAFAIVEGCVLATGAESLTFLDFQNAPDVCAGSPFRACNAARSTKQPGCDLSCDRWTGCCGDLTPRGFEKFVTTLIPAFAFCFLCRPLDLILIGFCTEYLFSDFRELERVAGLEGFVVGAAPGGLGHCVILIALAAFSWLSEIFSSSSHHSVPDSFASFSSSTVPPAAPGKDVAWAVRSAMADVIEIRSSVAIVANGRTGWYDGLVMGVQLWKGAFGMENESGMMTLQV